MRTAWFCVKVFYSAVYRRERERERERAAPGSDLALAQRDGTHFLGELHDIRKFVEVSSGVCARGEHKDEGGGEGRLLEDHRQV